MRRAKAWLAAVPALLLILSLLSCRGAATEQNGTTEAHMEDGIRQEEPQGLVLASSAGCDYRIVYREGASTSEMHAVNALRDRLRQTGAAVSTCDDYLAWGETVDAGTKEILIGETNRDATKTVLETLGERDYAACAVGAALVVVGKTETLTVQAVEVLTQRLETDGQGRILFTEQTAFRCTAPQVLRVSFLGDSITTYEGYSDNGSINETLKQNPTWYKAGTLKASETWWYGVCREMDWELCVNNSYSGGRVSNAYSYETRACNLHTDAGMQPDVILIYYGINDYNNMVPLDEFRACYGKLLDAVRSAYPEAKIFCGTLIPIECHDNGRNTTLTENGAGVGIAAFNRAIVSLAAVRDIGIIDFAVDIGADQVSYTYDRIHPNAAGMKRMCEAALSVLRAEFPAAGEESMKER